MYDRRVREEVSWVFVGNGVRVVDAEVVREVVGSREE